MNMLLGALNLGGVSGDPNALPAGRYDGRVTKSEYAVNTKQTPPVLNHVVGLKVESNDQYNGRTQTRFFKLGENPVDANGQPTTNPSQVVHFNQTMTDNNKDYYKKLWLDCGVPAHLVDSGQATPDMLLNAPVVFGVGERNGYLNVTFIDKRDVAPVAPLGMQPGMVQPGMPFGMQQPAMAQGQAYQPQPQQVQQQPQPFQQAPVMNPAQQPVQTQPQPQVPNQQPQQAPVPQVNPWENAPVQQDPNNPWQDLTSPETIQQQMDQGAAPPQPTQAPQVTFGGGPVSNEQSNQIAPGVPN
jgi:hypothetical protein